jgi:ethanolamine ammonia-lyase large subunit
MLNLAPAPEFEQWLTKMGAMDERGSLQSQALPAAVLPLLAKA